jgi:hypothetical protein
VAADLGGQPVVLREREGGHAAEHLFGVGRRRDRHGAAEVLEDRQLQVRGLAEEGEQVGRELCQVDLRGRFYLGPGAKTRNLCALALARKPIDHVPSLGVERTAGRAPTRVHSANG